MRLDEPQPQVPGTRPKAGACASMPRAYVLVLLLCSLLFNLDAAVCTWNTNVSGDWTAGSSWQGGTAPGTGDDVIFSNTAAVDVTMDVASSVRSITFQGTNPVTFLVSGGTALSIESGGITVNMASGTRTVTINCPLILAASQTWSYAAGNTLTIVGAVSGSAYDLSLTPGGTFNCNAAADLNYLRYGSTTTSCTVNSTGGALTLYGGLVNTSTGGRTWTINKSIILANDQTWDCGIAGVTSTTTIGAATSITGAKNLIVTGAGAAGSMRLNLNGTVNVSSLTKAGSCTAICANTIGPLGAVTVNGGVMSLTGTNTFSGDVTLFSGTIAVNGDLALGAAPGSPTNQVKVTGTSTLAASGPGLSFALSANRIISVANATTLTLDCAGSIMQIDSPITGAGGVKLGSSNATAGNALIMTANSDFTGAVAMGLGSFGTISLRHGNALGQGTKAVTAVSSNIDVQLQGDITIPSGLSFTTSTGNTATAYAFHNISGTNVIAGLITMTNGAGATLVKSDAGLLCFTGGITANTGTRDFNIAGAGAVEIASVMAGAGNASLTLNAAFSGTCTLLATNTYSNGTSVLGGTLRLGDGSTTNGTLAGNITCTSPGVVEFANPNALTWNGVISSTGRVVKSGAGTVSLGGASTYSGTTTINAGSMQVNIANALPNGTAVTLADVSGATLDLNSLNDTIASLAGGGTTGGNLTLGSGTLTVGDTASTAYAGVISGASGALTKQGSGTLSLTNTNTYTGATTISAGTLSIGDGTTDGSIATSSGITDNAALVYNLIGSRTYANVIGGSGTLTKVGAGTLTLGGANTYSGTTTINAGTLSFDGAGTTPNTNSVVVNNGGTLSFARNDTWGAAGTTTSAAVTVNAGGTLASGGCFTTLWGLTLNDGAVLLNGGFGVPWPAFQLCGTLTVTGTAAVTIGSGSNNMINLGGVGNDTLTINTAGAGDSLAVAAPMQNNPATSSGLLAKTGAGTLTLTATNTYTGTTTISAGTLSIGNGATDGSIATSAGIVDNAALVFNAASAETYGNVISGSGTLTKSGSGSATLGGTNTYSGTTTVSGGALLVNGSIHADSAVSVANGATLGGIGTVNGTCATANGSAVAPGTGGTTIGTITLANTPPCSPTATMTLAVDVSGGSADEVICSAGSGSLALGNISLAISSSSPSASSYTLLSYPSGAISGTFASVSGTPSGYILIYGATSVTLQQSGRYWVGTGNWSDTANWSSSAVGPGGSSVPTSSNDVFFSTSTAGTCTVDEHAAARSLTFNSGATVLAVDCGGSGSGSYLTDQYYAGGGTYSDGSTTTTSGVTNPAPEAVYHYWRQTPCSYTLPGLVAGGTYTVRLHFAELYWSSANQRKFNVSINGTQVLTNFDIVATAGARFTANIQSFTATADGSGQIVVATSNGSTDTPGLNGIEIVTRPYASTLAFGTRTLTSSGSADLRSSGSFTGTTGGLVMDAAGTLIPPSSGTIPNLTISAGTTNLATNALAVATALSLANTAGASLSLNNLNATVGELTGGGTTGGNLALGSGTLTVGDTASTAYAGVLSGASGALTKQGSGTLSLTNTCTYTGATTISAGTLSIGDGTTDGSIATSSGITDNAALVYNLVGSRTYANVIGGSGTLTKSGAGTLTLSNTNTYTGTTTASVGTLLITGSTHASSAMTVSAGATLGGTGTINGACSTANTGIIAPGTGGSTIATLTLANTTPYAVTATTTLAMDVTNGAADQLNLSGATGNVDLSGIHLGLTLTTPSAYPYTLVTCPSGTLTGSFASITGLPGGSPVANIVVTPHAVLLAIVAAPSLLSPVDNPGYDDALHTLNRRPALIWAVPQSGDALHFRVFADQVDGTTQAADSGVSLAGFAYWNGSAWSAMGGAAPASDGTKRVRWTPQADLAIGRTYWTVCPVDGGSAIASATVRSFRIDTPPWAGDTELAGGNRIRTAHIEQLRTEANAARAFRNEGVVHVFPAIVFTDSPLVANATLVRQVHIDELRSALIGVKAVTGSTVTIGAEAVVSQQTRIKAAHFLELRTALEGL